MTISCRKFVDIEPPKYQPVSTNVFTSSSTATAALTGIYSQMTVDQLAYKIAFFTGVSSDELINYSNDIDGKQFYLNAIAPNNDANASIWASFYSYIYQANSVIDGLKLSSIDSKIKNQLIGEALFIRSLCFFYLMNFYGPIPLPLSTDYSVNSNLGRSPITDIISQIQTDLVQAKALLSNNYVDKSDTVSTNERIRPNKSAAAAMLSRVLLLSGEYAKAESEASYVIDDNTLYSLETDLSKVFNTGSMESVLQLQSVIPGYNTNEGAYFKLTEAPISTGRTNCTALRKDQIDSFEDSDLRRKYWIDSIIVNTNIYYFPSKYKVQSSNTVLENTIVIRLSELYLIRAEARGALGNFSGATADLNKLRSRAGLLGVSTVNKESLYNILEKEYHAEFFTEWGFRWFNLKRWKATNAIGTRADQVLSSIKGAGWQSTDALYPIPQIDRNNNDKLDQNPGY